MTKKLKPISCLSCMKDSGYFYDELVKNNVYGIKNCKKCGAKLLETPIIPKPTNLNQ